MSQRKVDDSSSSLHLYLSKKNIEKIGKKLKVEACVNKELEQLQKKFITKADLKNELLAMLKNFLENEIQPSQSVDSSTSEEIVVEDIPIEVKEDIPEVKENVPIVEVKENVPIPEVKAFDPVAEVKENVPIPEFKEVVPAVEVKEIDPVVKQSPPVVEIKVDAPIETGNGFQFGTFLPKSKSPELKTANDEKCAGNVLQMNVPDNNNVCSPRAIPQCGASMGGITATLTNVQSQTPVLSGITITNSDNNIPKLGFLKKPYPISKRKDFTPTMTLAEVIDDMSQCETQGKKALTSACVRDIPKIEKREANPIVQKVAEPVQPKQIDSAPILNEDVVKIQGLDQDSLSHLLLKLMGEKAAKWGNECTADLVVKSQDEYILLQKYRNANPLHAKLLKDFTGKEKKKGLFHFSHKK